MKTEPLENRTELLVTVLEDDNYREFSNKLKQQSLDRFRRATRARRATRTVCLACGAMAASLALLVTRAVEHRQAASVASLTANVLNPDQKASAIGTLSDEEAMAYFPRGACFFAEVEGKKVLIFPNPVLRKRYLH